MDNNFSFPATFIKSGNEKNGRIPVTIVPSQPTVDRTNDKILLKAFDDECIKSFLFDGVLDYDHMSILGKTALERSEAIIGQPENMFIDSTRKAPVIEGFLFAKNHYVFKSIMPALEAESDRFGASLGGKILMKSMEDDADTQRVVNAISKIRIKHCAVTPLQKAVHQGTSITLRKSGDDNEYDIAFPDFGEFMKSIENHGEFMKALEAGAQTDISAIRGGQAVQGQSLEGDEDHKRARKKKIKTVMPFVLDAIFKGFVKGRYSDYMEYLTSKGLAQDEADELIKIIALSSPEIIKLTFNENS